MSHSEEAAAWSAAVYNAVREVPEGKVTSYGHIARLLGRPECPRQVGVSLKALPSSRDQPDSVYNDANVPWQRIINAKGGISPRGVNGASRQATALRAEGVQVDQGSLGEYTINFTTFGWFPDMLPSDLADSEVEEDDDEDDEDSG